MYGDSEGGKRIGKEVKREMWVSWARPHDPCELRGDCHDRPPRKINPWKLCWPII